MALLPLLKSTTEQHPGVRIVNVSCSISGTFRWPCIKPGMLQISSDAHTYIPQGLKLACLEDFNQDMGGVDDPQSNLFRYGKSLVIHTSQNFSHFPHRTV
jgi:hypothetical protein